MFESYLWNTWLGGTIIALAAGVVGFFVVMRGDSFLAHAVPHGSFAGAALASIFGVSSMAGMGAAAAATSIAAVTLGRRGKQDVVIALLLSFLLAGGSLVLSLGGAYANQVYGLLFGQVLAVSSSGLGVMAICASLSVLAVVTMLRPLLAVSVLPGSRTARGANRLALDIAFSLVLAAVTTASVPVVGVLLLFSLLVAPPAAACELCRTPARAMGLSCALCLFSIWASIALSVMTDFPVGFFVASISTVIYVVARSVGHR
ncbi:ABC-3 protein [Coriobacterium glomerans PW2]|uniref:ABC-3 protein n=1 Tax=Coriobacterium glomerans (strain ATCC 49209 / DSM 20642 / JCM 10262 / PW2) TaxID=700015 RepID=F2NAU1_CORGP|nr:metal ABC transporter permease [Coriobacterium glomerans]AEB07619.1 ABC-3 protein [Coriobacterium glomerans PW2]